MEKDNANTNANGWRGFIEREYKFFIIFIMLGLIMLWTSYIVQPILKIQDNQIALGKYAIAQNRIILSDLVEIREMIKNQTHID
jgi:hypothetical protein